MWHYGVAEQSFGPYSVEQMGELVRNGTINGDTLVWTEGMQSWVPARQSGLTYLFSPPPAPIAVPAAATPAFPVSTPAPKKQNKKVSVVASVIGAVIGFAAVRFLPHPLMFRILGGAVAGLICGLLPFFVGKNKNPKLAKMALTACAISGMVLGIVLALPVAIAFTIVITVKPAAAEG